MNMSEVKIYFDTIVEKWCLVKYVRVFHTCELEVWTPPQRGYYPTLLCATQAMRDYFRKNSEEL